MIKTTRNFFLGSALSCALALGSGLAKEPGNADLRAAYESDLILLQPTDSYRAYTIQVSGPNDLYYTLEFAGTQTPFVDLFDQNGFALADGQYTYQFVASPILDEAQKQELVRTRQDNTTPSDLPMGMKRSGSFLVAGGQIVLPDFVEEGAQGSISLNKGDETTGSPVTDADTGRDQVIADDLIVQGSICSGFDCVNNESFGADTLRLKENNLRIHFEDTSSTGAFSSNDWRITANDQASGGASYLSIDDVTGSKVPFKVTAGAPTNSLLVSSSGNLGLGTATPVLDLHIVNGNSPAMRLEQDASSGFTAQTWDVAGNEAGFFVRDVTGGSRLPFRIIPGASTNSLYINSSGNVGINTASPSTKLDVNGAATVNGISLVNNDAADATAPSLQVENMGSNFTNTLLANTSATLGSRVMLELQNKGFPKLRFNNTTIGAWFMGNDNSNNFQLVHDSGNKADLSFSTAGVFAIRNGSDVATMTLDANGNLVLKGTLTENGTPKRSLKQDKEIADLKNQVSTLEARIAALEKLLLK